MSNNHPNTRGIKDAAQKKRTDTLQKVLDALITMKQQSIPVNFNSVSRFTGVTKAWLYKQPEVKERIQQAKENKSCTLFSQDQILNLNSKNQEIDILTRQNRQLRQEIEELRQQLEVAYAALYNQDN